MTTDAKNRRFPATVIAKNRALFRAVRQGSLAHQITGLLATAAVGQGLLVATGVLSARLLGPVGRGEIAILLLWVAVASGVTELGMQSSYAVASARSPASVPALLANLPAIAAGQVLLGFVVYGVITIVAVPTNIWDTAIVASLILPLSATRSLLWGIERGTGAISWFNASRIAQLVPYLLGLGVLFVLNQPSVALVVLSVVAGYIVSTGIGLFHAQRAYRVGRIDRVVARGSLTTGVTIHIGNLASGELVPIDLLLATLTLSPAGVGIYAVARAFMQLPGLVGNSFGIVAMRESAESTIGRGFRRIFQAAVVTTTIVLPLAIAIPFLTPFLFGSEFGGSVRSANILLVAGAIISLRRVTGDVLRGAGHARPAAVSDVVGQLVSVVTLAAAAWSGPVAVETVATCFAIGQAMGLLLQVRSARDVHRQKLEPS